MTPKPTTVSALDKYDEIAVETERLMGRACEQRTQRDEGEGEGEGTDRPRSGSMAESLVPAVYSPRL